MLEYSHDGLLCILKCTKMGAPNLVCDLLSTTKIKSIVVTWYMFHGSYT